MIEPIETDRLRIRDVVLADCEAFFGYMKLEEYWRDVPIDPPTLPWVQSLVQRCLQDQTASPRTNYFLAAACKQSGTVIGEAILRVESVWHGRGEVGWGVALQYTGRGFGTKIGQAIVRLGFELGLHRLYAPVSCR